MSRKKKQRITMFIALFCLVSAGIGYVYASRYASEKEAKEEKKAEEDDSIELYSYEKDDIREISFENSVTAMKLVREGEKWCKADEKAFPVDQEKAGDMADSVCALISSRMVLENPKNLDDYGLDIPALTVTLKTKDGEEVTLYIGDESSAGGGYYGYTSLSDTIYIITDSVYDNYDYTEKQMIEMEDTPAVVADNMTMLHVKPGSKKAEEFEARYDEDSKVSKDIFGWDLRKPFKETVAGDRYALSELFAKYTELAYTQCEDYSGKRDSKYGLDKPRWEISLKYYTLVPAEDTEEGEGDSSGEEDSSGGENSSEEEKIWHDYKLYVGDKDKSKAYYYVKPEGSDRVYTMEADMVEGMVDITPMDYIYANMYLGTVYTINEIDMDVEGKSYHMELTRKEKEDKEDSDTDGEEAEETEEGTEGTEGTEEDDKSQNVEFHAFINGKEVDEQAFRLNYGSAGALKYSGLIDESVKASDKPYCTITMKETEREVTLKFLPYDEKSYRVNVDGQQLFTTDKAAVDSFVQGFIDLASQKAAESE